MRWDRVGRVSLLLVLLGVLGLYVHPVLSYYATWREARQTHAQISTLQRQNRDLRAQRHDLRQTATIEREARQLGMVGPGERAYSVRGLSAAHAG